MVNLFFTAYNSESWIAWFHSSTDMGTDGRFAVNVQ